MYSTIQIDNNEYDIMKSSTDARGRTQIVFSLNGKYAGFLMQDCEINYTVSFSSELRKAKNLGGNYFEITK